MTLSPRTSERNRCATRPCPLGQNSGDATSHNLREGGRNAWENYFPSLIYFWRGPLCRPEEYRAEKVDCYNYSMFRLSVDLLSDGDCFLSQRPFSGTPCNWTSSHRPLYPLSINGSRHFFTVNLSPHFTVKFLFSPYTCSRGLRNSFTTWDTLKIAIDWLTVGVPDQTMVLRGMR